MLCRVRPVDHGQHGVQLQGRRRKGDEGGVPQHCNWACVPTRPRAAGDSRDKRGRGEGAGAQGGASAARIVTRATGCLPRHEHETLCIPMDVHTPPPLRDGTSPAPTHQAASPLAEAVVRYGWVQLEHGLQQGEATHTEQSSGEAAARQAGKQLTDKTHAAARSSDASKQQSSFACSSSSCRRLACSMSVRPECSSASSASCSSAGGSSASRRMGGSAAVRHATPSTLSRGMAARYSTHACRTSASASGVTYTLSAAFPRASGLRGGEGRGAREGEEVG